MYNLIKLLCLILIVNLARGAAIKKGDDVTVKSEWWKTASFYQIYPKSFQDSNGDGIGDINGITSRLNYFNEIGIDATWLSPIFKSPMVDNGYDISDFYEIDAQFGTMEDFEKLIKEAHKRNIKIILDFVPNHSSNEHVWFTRSENRDEGYDDYYVWHDGKIDKDNAHGNGGNSHGENGNGGDNGGNGENGNGGHNGGNGENGNGGNSNGENGNGGNGENGNGGNSEHGNGEHGNGGHNGGNGENGNGGNSNGENGNGGNGEHGNGGHNGGNGENGNGEHSNGENTNGDKINSNAGKDHEESNKFNKHENGEDHKQNSIDHKNEIGDTINKNHRNKRSPTATKAKPPPPCNWVSVFRGGAWEWSEKRGQYYYHQFYPAQPDLNFRSERVKNELKEILKFWLDKGVDGFRIDAFPHLLEKFEADGSCLDEERYDKEPTSQDKKEIETLTSSYDKYNHTYTRDLIETNQILYEWREFLDEYAKNADEKHTRVLMVESYSRQEIKKLYFGDDKGRKGSQIPFNFILMGLDKKSTAEKYKEAIDSWMNDMTDESNDRIANWVLGNHDVNRIHTRFGPQRTNMLNMLILSLPGISVTYYGEEIGMKDVDFNCPEIKSKNESIACEERNNERTPMQWDDSTSGGFSSNSTTWIKLADDYKLHNVKKERGIAKSHLNIFKKMTQLRHLPVFQTGKFDVQTPTLDVVAITRTLENEMYLFLINTADTIETYDLKEFLDVECIVTNEYSQVPIGKQIKLKTVQLLPHEAIIYRKIVPETSTA